MCDNENSLESHLLRVLEMCLSVVLATIIIRASDFISYKLDRWLESTDDVDESLDP